MKQPTFCGRELLPLSVIEAARAGEPLDGERVLRYYEGYIDKLCTRTLYDLDGSPHVRGGRVHEAPIAKQTDSGHPEQPIRKRRTRWPAGPAPGAFLWVYSTHFKAHFSVDWSNPIAVLSIACQKPAAAAYSAA